MDSSAMQCHPRRSAKRERERGYAYLRALSAGTPAGTAAMGRWRLHRRGAACDCVSCATHAETWHSVMMVCEAGVCFVFMCVNHMWQCGRESGLVTPDDHDARVRTDRRDAGGGSGFN